MLRLELSGVPDETIIPLRLGRTGHSARAGGTFAPVFSSPPRSKARLTDLALFGGLPAFDRPLHVGRPNIGRRERILDLIGSALDERQLTNQGPLQLKFEERLQDLLSVRHCVAVANGTLGLILTARAMGLHGDVVMPSFTFVGTAHALYWEGIRPVFCDIDPVTLQIDPCDAERRLTTETTAILGIHLYGRRCNDSSLARIARRRGIRFLVDSAHELMSPVHGDAAVLSFHATKVINTFEGGAVVTHDGELAERIRLMRNFGFVDFDKVAGPGINAKLSEPAAAMGLASLEVLDEVAAAERCNFTRYRQGLEKISGLSLLPQGEGPGGCHYVIIEADESVAGIRRDTLLAVLRAENVLARRYFYPGCHRLEPYASDARRKHGELPHTERAAARVLALPTGNSIGEMEIVTICEILRTAFAHGFEIEAKIARTRVVGR